MLIIKKMVKLRRRISLFILLIIPIIVVVGVIFVFPLLQTFYLSFFRFKSGRGFNYVGLDNFRFLLEKDWFLFTIARTFIYMIGIVSINFLLGFGFALLTYRPFKGVSLIRSIIVTPMLFIPAAASIIWNMLYQPQVGLINHMIDAIGLERIGFLGKSSTAFPAVMVTDIWGWTPFVYLILVAGLQTLPNEPFEAADLDGASSFQKFRHLTLPMMRSIILIAILIKCVDTFRSVDYVWIMTRGGPGSSSMILGALAYRTAFIEVHLGLASTIAVIFFLLSLFLTVLVMYFYMRGE